MNEFRSRGLRNAFKLHGLRHKRPKRSGRPQALEEGELDLLYCLGGNFLRTLPDPDYVRKALASVPMRVHQEETRVVAA